MTAAQARQRAATYVLGMLAAVGYPGPRQGLSDEDCGQLTAELRLIESWLRRKACLGDETLIRQLERETGRQVKPPAA